MTLCIRKPHKGEKPARGRKYASEIQRILVEKGTKTYKKDIAKIKKHAQKLCERRGKKLVRKGKEDYICK
ncbi:hypothetical protein KJ925_05720 [Patescibacteria group bacterium]|nr:hypothetical protein [Patescibacteria group bacterium]